VPNSIGSRRQKESTSLEMKNVTGTLTNIPEEKKNRFLPKLASNDSN
jgi:hypothetical protein